MSNPNPPQPAKLIIGLFMKDKKLDEQVAEGLIQQFGAMDVISSWLPFDYTEYYQSEMGAPLFRRMFSFKELIDQGALANIKTVTNSIEEKYCTNNKRLVNIDPGYMLPSRFVLATGKNYAHRIYIGKGIYADLTLIYTKGEFTTLPWTYPDYAAKHMLAYLLMVRKKYISDYKNKFSGKNE
ncbi:MAG: DUF4416 family protein [Desulfosarcina sp.]|nr:DUF4416 family protein [Desulfobacterales bacterium]